MGKKIQSLIKYFIFLAVGLLLVWWQLHSMTSQEKTDFKNAIANANYILVIPVVIMNLASHLARSLRWKLLMQPLQFNPKLSTVFAATMVGYLANSAVPRLGEILKCSLLAKYENLKTDKLIGTILIERMFDLICYLIFIIITILIQINVIGAYVNQKISTAANTTGTTIWLKIIIAICIGAAIIYVFKK